MNALQSLAALAAALGSQPFLWLQTASLTHLAQGQSFFQGLIYLNLLGTPVPQLVVAVVLLTVGLTLAYAWEYETKEVPASCTPDTAA